MTCCADRVEMEGEREVRGEEERRELLQASCEGHRRAAGVLQLECCKKKGQDGVFEMAIWKENSSPVVSESQESCLTETEEKAGKERELTAKRRREGEEEDEKTESFAKREREEEDEREGLMAKRKREGEEGGEREESLAKRSKEEEEGDEGDSDDEWVDIDPSQVPPHKEVVKKQRKKAKPRGRERRKEDNSTKAVDIRFAYPLPPRCSVKPQSFLTQSEHRLQAEVRRRGETMVAKVTSQSHTPAGLPWLICVELIHPEKSPLSLKAEEGAYEGRLGETLCTVEILRSDLEQFVHRGVVCVRVCHS